MHPSTRAILKHFTYEHLPEHLQSVSIPFCRLANVMAHNLDGPEVTAGLRKLLEAKDCMVRAAVEAHDDPLRSECRCIQSMQGCPVHDPEAKS